MNAPPEFIPGPYTLARACVSADCGGHDFDVYQKGPHLAAICITCGMPVQGWIARSEVGLAPRKSRRDGFSPDLRTEVLQRWQHRCAWCGVPATEAQLVVGHIIPRAQIISLYGEDIADHFLNLAPSCTDCNAGAHRTSVPAVNLLLAAIRIAATNPWE